jgi:hypothetical protein
MIFVAPVESGSVKNLLSFVTYCISWYETLKFILKLGIVE